MLLSTRDLPVGRKLFPLQFYKTGFFHKHPTLPIFETVTCPSDLSCSLVCATSGLKCKRTGLSALWLQQQLFSKLRGGRALSWACPPFRPVTF